MLEKVLDGQAGQVELIDPLMPPELRVVNAARVSNAKRVDQFVRYGTAAYRTRRDAQGLSGDDRLIEYLHRNEHWTPFGHARWAFIVTADPTDPSFTHWLARRDPGWAVHPLDGRWFISGSLWNFLTGLPPVNESRSMFAAVYHDARPVFDALGYDPDEVPSEREAMDQCGYARAEGEQPFTFRMTMPLFVARQWMRSNQGVVYNETSRRYVSDDPEFYIPDRWRRRATTLKQGSGEGHVDSIVVAGALADGFTGPPDDAQRAAAASNLGLYRAMIDGDIAPEMARMVLPQSMMTEFWMTASADALARIIGLRQHEFGKANHAQSETAQYARAIRAIIDQTNPNLISNLLENQCRVTRFVR